MPNIPLDGAALDFYKRALAQALPDVKSSHRVEALAAGLRYEKYASLLAAVLQSPSPLNAPACSAELLLSRLETLGYSGLRDRVLVLERALGRRSFVEYKNGFGAEAIATLRDYTEISSGQLEALTTLLLAQPLSPSGSINIVKFADLHDATNASIDIARLRLHSSGLTFITGSYGALSQEALLGLMQVYFTTASNFSVKANASLQRWPLLSRLDIDEETQIVSFSVTPSVTSFLEACQRRINAARGSNGKQDADLNDESTPAGALAVQIGELQRRLANGMFQIFAEASKSSDDDVPRHLVVDEYHSLPGAVRLSPTGQLIVDDGEKR